MNQKVFNHILIGLKELPAAEPLVRFAGFFARQLGAKLTFLMVITNERERRAADGTLDLVREMLRDTIVEKKVLLGPKPTQEMLHELESGDYDLLAVSKVGRNLLSTLSLRPKSEVVPQPPKYSLLVVPAARARLQKMLICTGGREIAELVVQRGAQLSQVAQAKATLLHIASPVPSMYTGLEEVEERLDELLQTDTPLARHLRWCARLLDEHNVTAEIKLLHGTVVEEILREARQGDYDLIVIGAHVFSSPWTELMMGNITRQVIEHAPCPVLMVYRDH